MAIRGSLRSRATSCPLVGSQIRINRIPHLAGFGPVGKSSVTSRGPTHVVTASSFTFIAKGDAEVSRSMSWA